MQTRNRVLPSLKVALTATGLLLFTTIASPAVEVGTSYHHDVSPALRDLAPPESRDTANTKLGPLGVLPLLVPEGLPPIILSFDGISFNGTTPPHNNGAAGLTQYVQVAGDAYQVFDKSTGTSLFGPSGLPAIWAGSGGPCQNQAGNDPSVLYDRLANRWVISQIAGATDVCVAVSTTSDAIGTYYRYGFHLGSNFFDGPHFGSWPDGYYMSINVFNSSGTTFLGPQAFAFDRTKMLAGNWFG